MKPRFVLPLAASLLALSATPSFALGIRIVDQNPRATARGEAFSATADNPSAVYYNPAGIAQLDGTRALLGAYTISIDAKVDLDVPDGHFDSKYELQTVPQFFATWKLKGSPIALGLGIYAPFGFGLEYPDDTPFRTLAKEGRILYLTINPVIAWEICESVSIAAGATINYGDAKLTRGVLASGDEFEFEGDGVAYGFNLGALWHPHPMHHFGLVYRSSTSLDFSGRTRVHTDPFTVATPFGPFVVPGIDDDEDARARFHFPQSIVAGYSFRPAPDWNFEFNIDWTDWDSLDTVTIKRDSGDLALPFNWESSFIYSFGITKSFPDGWSVSGGYIYSENSVPNQSFNPIVPDSNRHIWSVGLGRRGEHFNFDVAYQYAWGPERHISNGTLANGNYEFQSHALTFTLGWDF
jgi:long-chain fatty acid transport protein